MDIITNGRIISMVKLVFSMSFRGVRQFLTLCLIPCYLLLAVGDQTLHLFQCTSSEISENSSSARHTYDSSQESSQNRTDTPSVPVPSHDSSNCAVCQTLGQAQQTVAEFKVVVDKLAVGFAPAISPTFFCPEQLAGFHSRAPPLV